MNSYKILSKTYYKFYRSLKFNTSWFHLQELDLC